MVALYAELDYLEAAYLAEAEEGDAQTPCGLLIALTVNARDAERAARIASFVLQSGEGWPEDIMTAV